MCEVLWRGSIRLPLSPIIDQRAPSPSSIPLSLSLQYFSPNLCRCECTDREAKAACFMEGSHKIWDEDNCRCRCAEAYRECSTGHIYDQTNTCRYSLTKHVLLRNQLLMKCTSGSCVPELRPASSIPMVALAVALVGTLTCLVLVIINYRRTRKVLKTIQRQRGGEREEEMSEHQQETEKWRT